ncbi:MAG: nitronate monooxygenase [Chloroflexi bacterium]|nr:nitronate monooxygenase [Chloroflexota bacterium]
MEINRLCDLLGIRYPIIQAPMNWICGADLVAAVSNAGGLGTLGANAGATAITTDVLLTGERLRGQIRKVKGLTSKPFAVNIAIGGRKYSEKCVEVALEEGVPVAMVSAGSPDVYTKVLRDAGIKVLHAISTVRHARVAEDAGVHGVICEGFEGGGYKSPNQLTTFVLVPMVADAVSIPVVAAGGIADARGVMAALALGADGVCLGTRFMLTQESDSHPAVKEAIVKADDVCTVSIPQGPILSQYLANQFTRKYLEMKAAGTSPKELNDFISEHSQYRAQVLGDFDGSEVFCGQSAGLMRSVLSAAQVVQEMMEGVHPTLEALQGKLSAFL